MFKWVLAIYVVVAGFLFINYDKSDYDKSDDESTTEKYWIDKLPYTLLWPLLIVTSSDYRKNFFQKIFEEVFKNKSSK